MNRLTDAKRNRLFASCSLVAFDAAIDNRLRPTLGSILHPKWTSFIATIFLLMTTVFVAGCPPTDVACTENDDCVNDEVCTLDGTGVFRCVVLSDEPEPSVEPEDAGENTGDPDAGNFDDFDAGDLDGGIVVQPEDGGADAGTVGNVPDSGNVEVADAGELNVDAGSPPVVEGVVFYPLLPLSGAQVLQSSQSNTWGHFLLPKMSLARLTSPDGALSMTLLPPSAL